MPASLSFPFWVEPVSSSRGLVASSRRFKYAFTFVAHGSPISGGPSQTLSYPRFTHAFVGLMVIHTNMGNTFPVYLRSWELNDYSHPTSSIKLSGWMQGKLPHSYLPSIPVYGFYHPSFGETSRTIRFWQQAKRCRILVNFPPSLPSKF